MESHISGASARSAEWPGRPVEICSNTSACRKAALRAYQELRDRGVMDQEAFNSAVRVFKHHHPEALPRQAQFTVAEWIAPDA